MMVLRNIQAIEEGRDVSIIAGQQSIAPGKSFLRRLAGCCILLLFPALLHAEKVFDFSNTCQQAYLQITSLKLNTGAQLLQQACTRTKAH